MSFRKIINGAPVSQGATTSTDIAVAISELVGAAPETLDTLNELAAALGDDANFSATVINSISTKAPIANPTFTGTVAGVTKAHVGLGNVDNTSDANKPVSIATQDILNTKASIAYTDSAKMPKYNSAIYSASFEPTGNTYLLGWPLQTFSGNSTGASFTSSFITLTYPNQTFLYGKVSHTAVPGDFDGYIWKIYRAGNFVQLFPYGQYGTDTQFPSSITSTFSSWTGGEVYLTEGLSGTTEEVSYQELLNLAGSNSNIQNQLDSIKRPTVNPLTNNYTITPSDSGTTLVCLNTLTVTIPGATFSAGDSIDLINIGTGIVTFAADGLTLGSADGAVTIDTQYAAATLMFIDPNSVVLVGRIS